MSSKQIDRDRRYVKRREPTAKLDRYYSGRSARYGVIYWHDGSRTWLSWQMKSAAEAWSKAAAILRDNPM